jgi:hypothetical protein
MGRGTAHAGSAGIGCNCGGVSEEMGFTREPVQFSRGDELLKTWA